MPAVCTTEAPARCKLARPLEGGERMKGDTELRKSREHAAPRMQVVRPRARRAPASTARRSDASRCKSSRAAWRSCAKLRPHHRRSSDTRAKSTVKAHLKSNVKTHTHTHTRQCANNSIRREGKHATRLLCIHEGPDLLPNGGIRR